MAKLTKAGRSRHSYKMASGEAEKAAKDTIVTLEVGSEPKAAANDAIGNEFTDCAHLRQVMCLMPSQSDSKTNEDEA